MLASFNFLLTITEANNLQLYYLSSPTTPVYSLQLYDLVTCLDVSANVLLLGFTNNKFAFIDLTTINLYGPADVIYNDSQLKSQITSAAVNADRKEFCIGSCDGRVYKGNFTQQGANNQYGQPNQFAQANTKVLYTSFHNSEDTTRNFVYVAHSKKRNDNSSDLFNISSMGFNSRSANFIYTVGNDGMLNYWDVKEKNKIVTVSVGGPVNCAHINSSGTLVAFGIGYDWSQGCWGLQSINYKSTVGFRPIGDQELVFRNTGQANMNQQNLQFNQPNKFSTSFSR